MSITAALKKIVSFAADCADVAADGTIIADLAETKAST